MKILFIAPYFPFPPDEGGKIRIYSLLKELSKENEIYFASLIYEDFDNKYIDELKKYCKRIEVILHNPPPRPVNIFSKARRAFLQEPDLITKRYNHNFKNVVDKLYNETKFDIIHSAHLYTIQYILDKPLDNVVLSEHNIESEIFQRYVETPVITSDLHISKWRWRNKLEVKKLRDYENNVWNKIEHIITVSERDREVIRQRTGNKRTACIIPNGVDISFFHDNHKGIEHVDEISHKEMNLVYTGSFTHYPNTDAILYFYNNVYAQLKQIYPNIKLYVVGKKPYPDLIKLNEDENVIVTGYVKDVRPYIKKSDIYIVPLRIGGGSRLKILQAMSMRKCIISTSIGAEGIDCTDRKNILIADTPEEIINAVKEAVTNKELKTKIETEAIELVKSKYDWSIIAETLKDYYNKISGHQT